ncbi:MAG: AAA family ATPase [Pseudomonadota bacterium]
MIKTLRLIYGNLAKKIHPISEPVKEQQNRLSITPEDHIAHYQPKNLSGCPDIYSKDRSDRSIELPLDLTRALITGKELRKMTVTIRWAVDGLLPLDGITLLPGAGGVGKTYLCMALAESVSKGSPFMGLHTNKRPVVFIDFENPLPVLVERIKKLGCEDVQFWHTCNDIMPPRLDSSQWEQYRELPTGSLLIVDTLRASQGGDENDSRQMANIMQRLKALRDNGFTILLLHHTPKWDTTTYKGSTAILDLADHVITLCKTTSSIIGGGGSGSTNQTYRLGTSTKTRYTPCEIFLTFEPEKGFVPAPDPDMKAVETIHELIKDEQPLNQSQIYELVKQKMSITNKERVLNLLKKGEGVYWNAAKDGKAMKYTAIVDQTTCPPVLSIKEGTNGQ